MPDPRDLWGDPEWRRQQEQLHAERLTRQQGLPELVITWDNVKWLGTGPYEAPPPPLILGEAMIAVFPTAEEIDPTEKAHVESWLVATAVGKNVTWPGFPLCLRVNGKSRYVTHGSWECREGDKNIYVSNGPGVRAPVWAPSCMMAIARYYRLDKNRELVGKIHTMLATIVAKEVIPVMTEVAEDYNGNPIIEIAVHKEKKLLAGKFPGGEFRHLSGEIVEINGDWVR